MGICRERGKPSEGPAVDRRFGGLWLVEDGKITSWTIYLTPREAVRAAKELLGGRVDPEQVKRATRSPEVKTAEPEAAPEEPEAALEEPEAALEEPEAAPQRPRKKALTKSEEQKRAARARAQMRKRASRQSA